MSDTTVSDSDTLDSLKRQEMALMLSLERCVLKGDTSQVRYIQERHLPRIRKRIAAVRQLDKETQHATT